MVNRTQFYIDGAWVNPVTPKSRPVVNPATEQPMYDIALGSAADVDKAVAAARSAFETFSQTSREERVALLTRIVEALVWAAMRLSQSRCGVLQGLPSGGWASSRCKAWSTRSL